VELMSTYYYVHWLPMAMYCSIAGYILAVNFNGVDEMPYFHSASASKLHEGLLVHLALFALLGAICGKIGDYLVRFSCSVFKLRYRRFRSTARGLLLVVAFTCVHNIVSYTGGGILWKSQKLGTVELLEPTLDSAVQWIRLPMDFGNMNGLISLVGFGLLKFCLTGISIVMPVPAGVFTCVFELGAAVGRLFGEFVDFIWDAKYYDPSVFAMVGAAAVTIGFVHAISVAVVMVELTGSQSINLLPLAVGCLTSYIVSKGANVDFFSAMIKLRRLPFVLGLRETNTEERRWWRQNACGIPVLEFMSTTYPYVTPSTTNREALNHLAQGKWQSCAFVTDDDHRLLGTVQRRALAKACGNAIRQASHVTNYSTMSTKRAAEEKISFLQKFDPVMGHPAVDPAPFQLPESTPFWKVATYFQMLGISTAYVTRQGILVGQLSKAQFIEYNNSLNRRQELRSATNQENLDSIRKSWVPTVL